MHTYHSGWGNPMHELMGKEKKSCKECIHQSTEKAFGIEVNFCAKGKKKMVKCNLYKDKNYG